MCPCANSADWSTKLLPFRRQRHGCFIDGDFSRRQLSSKSVEPEANGVANEQVRPALSLIGDGFYAGVDGHMSQCRVRFVIDELVRRELSGDRTDFEVPHHSEMIGADQPGGSILAEFGGGQPPAVEQKLTRTM